MNSISLRQRIAAPRELVFEFLVEPHQLVRWLGTTVDIQPHPGGLFEVAITSSDVAQGTYLEVVPHRRVVFSWGWIGNADVPPGSTTVTIELTAMARATLVELTHTELPAETTIQHEGGWIYFLTRLAEVGEGREPGSVDVSRISQQPARAESTRRTP